MNTVAYSAWKKLTGLIGDERGNFGVTFAVMIIPVMGLLGLSMDYSRVINARTTYQAAVENASLAAASVLRTGTWAEAKQAGQDAFDVTIMETAEAKLLDVVLSYDPATQKITATAKGESPNYFGAIIGFEKMEFDVESEVTRPTYPLEVAMVLDTTFSMTANGKINSLKTSAQKFVDSLTKATSADVKIGIVPFAQYVNVGRSQLGKWWLNAADVTTTTPGSCSWKQDLLSKSGCRNVTTTTPRTWVPEACTPAKYNDGVLTTPAKCTPGYWKPAKTTTSETCTNYTYGPRYQVCAPAKTNTTLWNGCVASRNYPLNIKDENYQNNKVPGPNGLTCPSELTPLTKDKTVLKNAITKLTAVGSTYIPAGVTWGTRILSSWEPFNTSYLEATMEEKSGKRFMVVMTDGENVSSPKIPSSPLHTGTDVEKANTYTREACNYAKSLGITVYTVSFGNELNTLTKSLLQDCATDPTYYYDAQKSEDLAKAFEDIAQGILKLYVSR